jgi:hypothetical protein
MATRYYGKNTEQTITVLAEDNTAESITMENVQGLTEMGVSATDKHGDEHWACVTLDRDQLWEHIHNCLNALEGLK